MAETEVWESSEDLAALMRTSPDIEALQRIFDRESTHNAEQPHERAVSEYLASMGMLRTRPLLFALHAPQLPPTPMPGPGFEDLLRVDGFVEFLERGQRAAGALLSLVEYIRSRLPGYPDLPVPDLRPQAPRVDMDGLLDQGSMPWPMAVRNRSIESHGPPAAGLRGVDDEQWSARSESLLGQLRESTVWQAFDAAATTLSRDDREMLAAACLRFDEHTELATIHAQAGGLLMRQLEYRRAALAEARETVIGAARGYLDAFAAVDHLIDQAAAVISDRSVYAHLIAVPASADVSWQRIGAELVARASFAEGAMPFLEPGRLLAYAGDPPARGAWICQATRYSIHREMGATIDLEAVVLPASETLISLVAPEGRDA